ncbi:T9SS type B sorting domain-containing protein [Portibacter marinus]|uniref:T9SS type B sorting domain-containing protein n=1 Tax=Portibacter marinus TaxID=2898660 RepID=UPI001F1C0CB5|nr:gliding motility-associated C-terminal domain-containing protein [Portibacter marinus]
MQFFEAREGKFQFRAFTLIVSLILLVTVAHAQTSYRYLLTGNYDELSGNHVPLQPLANSDGETGFFNPFAVPTSTCPQTFQVDGYHFFDNAGLRFVNDDFIDCGYTIKFTFHVKDLDGSQGWVRLLNFTPSDDNGIYIKLTDRPTNGTLEFWPNGTVGADNFFNSIDLYQFVITRTCSGEVNIYVNGEFFASYDDSSDPLYLPNDGDNLIDFFQDDTAVPNEASPGWVKNIEVSNAPIGTDEIQEDWDNFCQELQDVDCAGVLNGTAVVDSCGVCLQPDDPQFNQSCFDCAGEVNGPAIIDSCGVCLQPDDPDFNQSCADCAGTPNGPAVIDSCGVCAVPDTDAFNASCADCAGTPNGSAILDSCGVCILPNDPLFNQSCLDCAGVPNGTAVLDECNVCLEPNDPDFNQSCTIKFYMPSAFSPNEDGINDVFEVFKSDDAPASIQSYRVFNIWGEMIHESRNFEFGDLNQYWDGKYQGEIVSAGIYIYMIEVLFENGTVELLKGDVAIIR